MEISNKEDWWQLAEWIVPKLEEYAAEFGVVWDAEAATRYVAGKDHEQLHGMLQKLWEDLPDNRSIRHHPFYDLCDLCSESWVFYEDG